MVLVWQAPRRRHERVADHGRAADDRVEDRQVREPRSPLLVLPGLRRGQRRRARRRPLRGQRPHVHPPGPRGRLRLRGVAGRPALVQWQHRHVRQLRRGHAPVGHRGRVPAPPQVHRAVGVHHRPLPRVLLRGRRAGTQLQQVHRRAGDGSQRRGRPGVHGADVPHHERVLGRQARRLQEDQDPRVPDGRLVPLPPAGLLQRLAPLPQPPQVAPRAPRLRAARHLRAREPRGPQALL